MFNLNDSSLKFEEHVANLPSVFTGDRPSGCIRRQPSDFIVKETLTFDPSGEGEHLFLYIEKVNCNTDWVAQQLQQHFQLRSQDIGYAGKKDRHSISTQWFSLHLPGKSVSLEALKEALLTYSCHILKAIRHNKKLRKGSIKKNAFELIVRNLSSDLSPLVVEKIKQYGFPNYFGYQRFGHHGGNLDKAALLFAGKIKIRSRLKRGMYLSAARAYLFNLILAERVKNDSWNRAIDGDCLSLAGSHAYFHCEKVDAAIQQRIQQADLHVSGWLAGRQSSESTADALAIESCIINDYLLWLKGLNNARLDSARRPMRVSPENLLIEMVSSQQLKISFALPAGSFATSLLRELLIVKDEALVND